MEFNHIPVLFEETIESLNIKADGIYIDGTVGGAGHSTAIAQRLTSGRLLSIDQDPDAIIVATERLKEFKFVKVASGNFSDIANIAEENGIALADGVLLDIGVSSHQLDKTDRGFSYHTEALLDMRMSQNGTSAYDLVNTLGIADLTNIIRKYGEDKNAFRIAKAIVCAREESEIKTTTELAEIIKYAVPAAVRRQEKHPARKTFQAIRIAVNKELEVLEKGLEGAFSILQPGGRLAVISFHSLEDRIVKEFMKEKNTGCKCPKDFPICVCGEKPKGNIIYKRGLTAKPEELETNMRARSARLRVIEKI